MENVNDFRRIALDASRYLHEQIMQQGEDAREVADIGHGKPLGHPLHPLLTDITIGAWSLGFFFDVLGFITGSDVFRKGGDALTITGTMSAVPTALTGLLDYSTIKKDAAAYGAAHGMLNGVAFFFYARSSFARLAGKRGSAFFFAALGMLVSGVSAWLGGDLVYRHRVGVNHAPDVNLPEWTPVMALDDLDSGEPFRAEVNAQPVLLFRRDEDVYAISAVCSHAGGPLDEGQVIDGVCIECPWHQSVFDMRDGEVVHSPATFEQPVYQVRIRDGQIELKAAQ